MSELKLLGISGSLRGASVNTKLVHEAARLFSPGSFELADLRLPLYDGDEETRNGIPPAVQKLADQILAADAVVISTPEYNQSFSGVLKNALDWVSRVDGKPWNDKPVALVAAAAGRAGGARAQYALRLAMAPFRVRVATGPEVLIASAGSAYDDDGRLLDDRYQNALAQLMDALKSQVSKWAQSGWRRRIRVGFLTGHAAPAWP